MLAEKVCIVAGGGHGLGEAVAIQLGELGATVVVNDLGTSVHGSGSKPDPVESTAQRIRDQGGQATAHFGDIASSEYAESLVADTVNEYGRVDGVVNFAGIVRDSILHKMSDEDFDDVVNVHLRGHFTLVRAIAGHWRERAKPSDELQSQRSLVLVSSHAALGNPGQANYSAAKAGVLGLMRTAARELYRYNVRTNALLPRAYTRFVETMPDEVRPEEHEVASPEDIAPVVAYLISDGAVDTVGCTITAAGDRIGLMADPTIERFSVKSDGWGIEELSEHFSETLGRGTTLKRVDHQF